MDSAEYKAAIESLGYTQEGFAELLGASGRSGQNWANKSVPPAVETMVVLLLLRPEIKYVLESIRNDRASN